VALGFYMHEHPEQAIVLNALIKSVADRADEETETDAAFREIVETEPVAEYTVNVPTEAYDQMAQRAERMGVDLTEMFRLDISIGNFLFSMNIIEKADEELRRPNIKDGDRAFFEAVRRLHS